MPQHEGLDAERAVEVLRAEEENKAVVKLSMGCFQGWWRGSWSRVVANVAQGLR